MGKDAVVLPSSASMCCPRKWRKEYGIGPACRPCPLGSHEKKEVSQEANSALMCCPKVWKLRWGLGPQCRKCPSDDDDTDNAALSNMAFADEGFIPLLSAIMFGLAAAGVMLY